MGESKHPDVLTAKEAVVYLRLDAVAPSMESALATLQRLTRLGHIHPLRWAKEHLYARPDLDRFVRESIGKLGQTAERQAAAASESLRFASG